METLSVNTCKSGYTETPYKKWAVLRLVQVNTSEWAFMDSAHDVGIMETSRRSTHGLSFSAVCNPSASVALLVSCEV